MLDAARAQAPICTDMLQKMAQFGMFTAEFYLGLGEPRTAISLPETVSRGLMGQCYLNAGQLAMCTPTLAYCEGYACRTGLPFPVHHAWCLDGDGQVLDVTWPYEPSNEYLGVALSPACLLNSLEETGLWGVLSEMLPPSLVKMHPTRYLDERWLPEETRMDAFWQRLRGVLQLP